MFPVIKSELLVLDTFFFVWTATTMAAKRMFTCLFSRIHSQLNEISMQFIWNIITFNCTYKRFDYSLRLAVVLIYERARYVDEFLNLHFNKMFLSLFFTLCWLLVLPFLNKTIGERFHFVFIGIRETTGELDDSYLRITNNSSPFC